MLSPTVKVLWQAMDLTQDKNKGDWPGQFVPLPGKQMGERGRAAGSGCFPCTTDHHLCIWVCAEMAIWVFKDVRDEHKPAIDWLKDLTGDKTTIITIRMEL